MKHPILCQSLGCYSLLSFLQGQDLCLPLCTHVKHREHTMDAHSCISFRLDILRKVTNLKRKTCLLTFLYHISKYWLFIYTVCSLVLLDSLNSSILTRVLWDSRTKALRGEGWKLQNSVLLPNGNWSHGDAYVAFLLLYCMSLPDLSCCTMWVAHACVCSPSWTSN